MGWRLGWVGALLAVVACTKDDVDDNDGAAGSSDSAPASESSSADDDGTSSTGSLSADASADAPEEAGDDEDDGDSGAPSGPCFEGEVQLTNVVLEVNVNRILDEDVGAVFDDQSWACAYAEDGYASVTLHYGPHAFGEPQNVLSLWMRDGVRTYDLAVDSVPPGGGGDELLYLGLLYQYESASFNAFDTLNQSTEAGTLDVVAHPVAGDSRVELTAVGFIGAPGSWEFDLHFTGDVVP